MARIPPPQDRRGEPLRALIFDSYYDAYKVGMDERERAEQRESGAEQREREREGEKRGELAGGGGVVEGSVWAPAARSLLRLRTLPALTAPPPRSCCLCLLALPS